MTEAQTKTEITFEDFKAEVLNDYRIARVSRECILLGPLVIGRILELQ